MSGSGGYYDDGARGNYRHDNHLQPPPSFQRPRSVPPPSGGGMLERGPMMTPATRSFNPSRSSSRSRSRSRGLGRSRSRSRSRNRSRGGAHGGPVEHVEHALKNTFTSSNSGLGIGILGAIVGGLAARHVSESTPPQGHHHHNRHNHDKDRESRLLISTVVGAAVGGLGANALERRLEVNRARKAEQQQPDEDGRGRSRRDKDDYRRQQYHDRHRVDLVNDHVYDERPPRRRRSEDNYDRRPYRPLDYS